MKVTVGMPAFNRAPVLRHTIQQVLDQTFSDFELIIYNDGSTDDTVSVVRSFADPRIVFLDRPNMGPPHPLNGILELARGEYIIILHDHDFFDPTLLEKSVKALDTHQSAGFVMQGSAWIDEDGVRNYREMLQDLPELNAGRPVGERMLKQPQSFNSIFHACSMVRRSAYEQVGKYYEVSFGLYSDTDLWLRLLRSFDFVYIREVLFKFRTREQTGHFLSNREFEVLNWNYRIHLANAERYFSGSALEEVKQLIERKRSRATYRLCLQYAATNNLERFNYGISQLKADPYAGGLKRTMFGLLQRTDWLTRTFSAMATALNNVRKLGRN